jgi:hypothetical protein
LISVCIVLIGVSASLIQIVLHRLQIQTSLKVISVGRCSGKRTANYSYY